MVIQRYLPSEFGNDVDRVHRVGPAKTLYSPPRPKSAAKLRPKASPTLMWHPTSAVATFNREEDIGTYTIRAVDDPRTLNKIIYLKTPKNFYSYNELVALWEKKIGKTLEKTYISEDKILKDIQEGPDEMSMKLSLIYSNFVKGDQTNFEIESSFGVEATELYPDIKYTTVALQEIFPLATNLSATKLIS
ncbi:Isoflavone reductase-like protein [Morella rubra]|uniref:Isoflavone reductase-like protein n=1 Tax=Morella rubra TaxID=262757 RepID=A0A6A1W686_9ROSI|nr:Isoflavone reductase-like protein [Morella rubra]